VVDVLSTNGHMLLTNLTSRFADGTYGVTSSGRRELDPPPGIEYRFARNRPADAVYAAHLQNLDEWAAAGRTAMPFAAGDGPRVSVELGLRTLDYLLERGTMVELDDADIARHMELTAQLTGRPLPRRPDGG
jgi:hypothetical protein